ncbi:MAG: PKD domain-containing protein [Thermoplasmata archaeon]|nr:PKD domain-containing protein [Thermoplasmata archaeon]
MRAEYAAASTAVLAALLVLLLAVPWALATGRSDRVAPSAPIEPGPAVQTNVGESELAAARNSLNAIDRHDGLSRDCSPTSGCPNARFASAVPNPQWTNLTSPGEWPSDYAPTTYDGADGYLFTVGSHGSWAYDGAGWTKVGSGAEPPDLIGASLAYDPVDRWVVMFGGEPAPDLPLAVNETWVYAAGQWTNISPTVSPPPRTFAALTWDAEDGYMVLFGGTAHSDTWTFLGGRWTNATPVDGVLPSSRAQTTLVDDRRDGYLVLFGGNKCAPWGGCFSGCAPDGPCNDTWLYRAGVWTNLTPQLRVSPAAREGAMAAYDAADGVVLLVGGTSTYGQLPRNTSFWQFQTGHWTPMATPAPTDYPITRFLGSATFDDQNNRVAFWVGGQQSGAWPVALFWYAAGNWSETAMPTSPPAVSSPNMVFDSHDGYVLLYDPVGDTGANSTWKYSEGRWSLIPTTGGPPWRADSAMAYDTADAEAVLFGGLSRTAGILNDTWTYTAGTWSKVQTNGTSSAPPARYLPGMAYDSSDMYIVLFDGTEYTSGGPLWFNDTWTFSAGVWSLAAPSSAPYPREAPSMVDYPTGSGVLLWGGENGCDAFCANYFTFFNDTWVFSAGNWRNITSNGSPPGVEAAGIARDPMTGTVAIFGGSTNSAVGDGLWTFNGTHWTSWNTPGPHGFDRGGSAFVGDPLDGIMLLFGGGFYQAVPADTWGLQFDPLVANVSVSPAFGASALTVAAIANVTTGSGVSNESWEFGDGTPPTSSSNVSHTYSAPGVYWAEFSATDSRNETIHLARDVLVQPNLSAQISANITDPSASAPVGFAGYFSGGAGAYASSWTFGDGNVSTGSAFATHSYSTNGSFYAVYSVTDGSNATASAGVWVQVGTAEPLSVRVDTNTIVGDAPLALDFRAETSGGDGGIVAAWTFGDGTSSAALAPTHEFVGPGVYDVNLTVRDRGGSSANGSVRVTVNAPLAVTANASATTGTAPLAVTFQANVVGGTLPIRGAWWFSIGVMVAANAATVTFAVPGVYWAQFHAFDAANASALGPNESIVVSSPLAALQGRVVSDPNPAMVGHPLNLTFSLPNATIPVRADWSLGSLTGCTGVETLNVQCIPSAPGNLLVTVNATDASGRTAEASTLVVVLPPPLEVSLSHSPITVKVGTTVTWSAQASGGEPPYHFAWTGLPSGCATPSPNVSTCDSLSAGTYVVKMRVTDSSGLLGPAFASDAIDVLPAASPSGTLGNTGPSLSVIELATIAGGATGAMCGVILGWWASRRNRGPPGGAAGRPRRP